eukprot:359394-Chlamydomonas_euryale.AAC.8
MSPLGSLQVWLRLPQRLLVEACCLWPFASKRPHARLDEFGWCHSKLPTPSLPSVWMDGQGTGAGAGRKHSVERSRRVSEGRSQGVG